MEGVRNQEHLQNIQVLTDIALTQLGLEALLVELLDRVRETLYADTAAILLLESGTQELAARAARGIEEEVYQDVRVPLRIGFAGRIAATRRPVVLDRVDETTVANPILWERGIQAMLGVPLLFRGHLIGVLHVGRLNERRFSTDDVELLELVAERVAVATQTRRLEEEQAAARLLERSLLPRALPACPGFEMAARYVSAERRDVGGDWYDLFVLPSGELWVIAGDVAGHGLTAAVVMGRLRSTMRSYALLGRSCEEVVELTNHKILHFEFGATATVVCATSSPPYDGFRICSAGHPPPIIALPAEPNRPVDVTPSPPLGVRTESPAVASTIAMPRGASLVLYTDGLVERRDEVIDIGIERLCAAIPSDQPQIVCRDVMRRLIGTTPPSDDIALVVLRRTAADND